MLGENWPSKPNVVTRRFVDKKWYAPPNIFFVSVAVIMATLQISERQSASLGMSLVIQVPRLFQQSRCKFSAFLRADGRGDQRRR